MKYIKITIAILLCIALIIVISMVRYNAIYRSNDISGDYTASAYDLTGGNTVYIRDMNVSFSGKMEKLKSNFLTIDATLIFGDKKFNLNESAVDAVEYFYLYNSDGSYFGTLIINPRRKTNSINGSFYLLPEIESFVILVGGSELKSSFNECTDAIVYSSCCEVEKLPEIISNLINLPK